MPGEFEQLLAVEWLNNTVADYLMALTVFLAGLVILKIVQLIVVKRAKGLAERTETRLDDSVIAMIKTIKPQFYWFISFYLALQMLDLAGTAARVIDIILIAWVTYQAIVALQIFLDYLIAVRFIHKDDRAGEIVSSILSAVVRIILWSLGILFVLQNVGVNVTSLIAGLGIGGLALALAAQKILEDLFSSLSIYFDRPFAIGDFIVAGETSGTVRKVGIKTTRIKSLSGEEVIVPNKDLTGSRIQNFKRMERRRISFSVGVTYDTPIEKLRKIPALIQEAVESTEGVAFGRAHLHALNDSSLGFDVVYHVDSPKYEVYMDANQEILLKIATAFEQEAIQFAFPTRMVHLATGDA